MSHPSGYPALVPRLARTNGQNGYVWYHNEPKLDVEALGLPVWRYLDLGKYLELIRSKTLWFSAARYLGDRWEGALFGDPETISGLEGEDIRAVTRGFQHRRKVTCISCWYSSERESNAMWNHYGHQGVAIKSHLMTLAYGDAIPNLGDLYHAIGSVHYLDHNEISEWPKNSFAPFFAKRVGFESEKEVRIVICDDSAFRNAKTDGGIAMEVDLNALIDEVRVSPDAPPYLHKVVAETTRALGCSAPVFQSDLAPAIRW